MTNNSRDNFGLTIGAQSGNNVTINANITNQNDLRDEEECLRYLSKTEPQDERQKLINAKGRRVDGTCQWITRHALYLSWETSLNTSALWISGGPGKGKTMISIFLTEELEKKLKNSENALLMYYFCDNKDADRNTGVAILKGLISQMLKQREALFRHILPEFRTQKENLFQSPTAQEALWRIFTSMLNDSDVKVTYYCIIDGLDECQQPSLETWLKECKTFFSQSDRNPSYPVCKFIFVSRDLPEWIQREYSKFDRIRLDPDSDFEVNHDLQRFITARVRTLAQEQDYPESLRTFVESNLFGRANGTFLWVSFVTEELLKTNATEARDVLQSIPNGLDAIYDRMLLQIQDSRKKIALQILHWVVMAFRPLALAELAIATGVKDNEDFSSEDIMRSRVKFCGTLIRVTDDEVVDLVHQSVKDYLLRKDPHPNARLDIFRVREAEIQVEILESCLNHLEVEAPKGVSYYQRSFLRYAIHNWPEHARRSLDYDYSHAFFRYVSAARSFWLKTSYGRDYRLGEGSSLLHVAVLLDLVPLAEKTLKGGQEWSENQSSVKSILSETDGRGNMPLVYAVKDGQEEMVKLMLENGADPDTVNCESETALQTASFYSYEMIVRLLLENGADVNQRREGTETALQIASSCGYEMIVRLLLENGADSNSRAENRISALQMASSKGNVTIVRLLLEHGAEVDLRGENTDSALQQASSSGYEMIVRLLLENGADVNQRGEGTESALQLASSYGCETIVQLLLETCAYDDLRGEFTALQLATRNGHEMIVRLLLENGAEVNLNEEHTASALQLASSSGFKMIVRLLLENGADVNLRGEFTALQLASSYGCETIVRCLLEHGAEVDLRGENTDSALQMLFPQGIKVPCDCCLKTARTLTREEKAQARFSKQRGVTRLLLKHGAIDSEENSESPSAITELSEESSSSGTDVDEDRSNTTPEAEWVPGGKRKRRSESLGGPLLKRKGTRRVSDLDTLFYASRAAPNVNAALTF